MASQGERKKKLGSGLLEGARQGITKRNEALRQIAEEHEEGTRRHNKRYDAEKK